MPRPLGLVAGARRLADPATDGREDAGRCPDGGPGAMPEEAEADAALRTVRLNCAGPPRTADLQQDVDRLARPPPAPPPGR